MIMSARLVQVVRQDGAAAVQMLANTFCSTTHLSKHQLTALAISVPDSRAHHEHHRHSRLVVFYAARPPCNTPTPTTSQRPDAGELAALLPRSNHVCFRLVHNIRHGVLLPRARRRRRPRFPALDIQRRTELRVGHGRAARVGGEPGANTAAADHGRGALCGEIPGKAVCLLECVF